MTTVAGQQRFHAVDYVVFIATLVIALGIGVFFSLTGGRQKSTSEYLTGDRNMGIIPVALSLVASFVSAVTVLGHPAEMFLYGSMYSLSWLAAAVGAAVAALLWVPVFHPLRLTSANEYLEVRFGSHVVKYLGCFYSVLGGLIYTGICLFGPSVAIEIVTGFPVWGMILLSGGVATIYTTIGGMKAVIWTDVFQSITMLVGVIAVIIQGCISVGGGSEVWRLAEEGGRIIFDDLSVDPRRRMTLWGVMLGTLIPWISIMGVLQSAVQRMVSVNTTRDARRAVLSTVIGILVVGLLSCFAGIVMYAFYHQRGCDPYKAGYVSNPNQLMPYFVMDVLQVPGVPGLFIAAAFSASLSSASSAINAASANIWSDILQERLPNIRQERAAFISKIIGFAAGVVSIILGLLLIVIGGTIVQAVISFAQATLVPSGVMFGLGALFPWANKWGAITGGVVGGVLPFWINMGSYTIRTHDIILPSSIEGCLHPNTSFPANLTRHANLTSYSLAPHTGGDYSQHINSSSFSSLEYSTLSALETTTLYHSHEPTGFLENLYSLSHMWINPLSLFLSFIIGALVSVCTGRTKPVDVDPSLLFPFVPHLLGLLDKDYRIKRESKHNKNWNFTAVAKSDDSPLEETKTRSIDI